MLELIPGTVSRCILCFSKQSLLIFILSLFSCLPYSFAQVTYRGAQVSPDVTRNDIDNLRLQKVNLVRYQIVHYWGAASLYDCNHYREVIVNATNRLTSQLLGTGVKYIIVLMMPFGDRHNSVDPVLTDPSMQNCMIEGLKDIVVRTKDISDVLGYDVYNEPLGNVKHINTFVKRLRAAVRGITKDKIVVVKPRHDSPDFYDKMPYYKDPKTWYGVHMYYPGGFTHHGVFIPSATQGKYPQGTTEAALERMRTHLSKVVAFQKKYNATIWVSEFGSSIFGDPVSREIWFRNCIRLFEEYKWHWTFHAYRESSYWDIEAYPNLLQLFRARWSKNR